MITTRRRLLAGLPALGLLSARADDSKPLENILFGSCLDTHEHPMLDRTLTLPRDLFIFMGDNIYADQGGIPMMQEKYALLKNSRFFRGLKNKPILATWDDHDFGLNDGGSEYAQKKEAQAEFWNWLDEPVRSPRRQQEGVYHAQSFGPSGKRVQVILLDTRYFRSALKKVPKDKAMLGGTSVPTDDESTTILGAAQWAWLEKALQVPAELRIVVSSVQFAPEAHGGECWANFPHEQKRLLSLLVRVFEERRLRLHIEFDDTETSARHADAEQAPHRAENASSAECRPFEHRLGDAEHHREDLQRRCRGENRAAGAFRGAGGVKVVQLLRNWTS
jgi:alkaline phosphatase D